MFFCIIVPMETQTKKSFWQKLHNFFEIILIRTDSFEHIEKRHHKFAKISRTFYTLLLVVIYTISLSTLVLSPEFLQRFPKFKVWFSINEYLVIVMACVDLFLWLVVSYKKPKPWLNLLKFPITFHGILVILIFLPSLNQILILSGFKNELFFNLRYLVLIRIVRLVILLRHFRPFKALFNVFQKERVVLFYTFLFIIIIILVFSVIFYSEELVNVAPIDKPPVYVFIPKEGQTEADGNQFFKAVYFATITMTTIGYGDLVPATTVGKAMVMVLSILGIAVFAIPSGIIVGGFINELKSQLKKDNFEEEVQEEIEELRRTYKPKKSSNSTQKRVNKENKDTSDTKEIRTATLSDSKVIKPAKTTIKV